MAEVFSGVSVRYKAYLFETFNGQVNGNYSDYQLEEIDSRNSSDKNTGVPLGFQAGLRVGLGY